jgi:hypothetical protein
MKRNEERSRSYSEHVVTDLTVHAVLAVSGYPYATNPTGVGSENPMAL